MEREKRKAIMGVSVKLCFRPSLKEERKGRLYYQIIIHRTSHHYNSTYCISLTEWDKQKGIIIKDFTSQRGMELTIIRKRVKWEMRKITEIAYRMTEENGFLIYESIIQDFEEQKALQSFTSFMQGLVSRLLKTDRIRTSETYLSTFKSFMRFRHNADIFLYEIDANTIENYEAYLRSNELALNSISFYMRILRTVLNKAVKQALIPSSDFFDNVYTGIDVTIKRAIRIGDIKRIKLLDLAMHPQLDFARDMFMLSLYFRGMSFIDMAYLQHNNLQNGYLVYYRKKTGQRLKIKWEKQMTEIILKYPKDSKYLLPILKTPDAENRKYFKNISKQTNRWLKKVGKMAGIQIPLTMYVARHSWASIAKQKNIPIGVISDALGHHSEKTTLIYLSTLDTSAIDNANSQILADL